jgi:CRISPR-associated protein Csb2
VLRITVRFPLGVYHAQSAADFATAEWPPHPVRLIAALTAAAHGRPAADLDAALHVIGQLAAAGAPIIFAPRASDLDSADGGTRVARLRGASRWAPRNHELAELRGGKGISPRDLGRGRAEVSKVGIAIGGIPIKFEWPDLTLDDDVLATLGGLVEEMTVLGTSRSPALVTVDDAEPLSDSRTAWVPTDLRDSQAVAHVRVATARTPATLDAWHARRAAPLRRDGAVAAAPYVPPAALGDDIPYLHGLDAAELPTDPLDPEWWGDLLVVAVDRARSRDHPKAPASFALARAMRKALLDTYGPEGTPEEAPEILRARGAQPHAAFVPLSFVAELRAADVVTERANPGAEFADGRTLGVAVLLPHPARLPDVARQRLAVEAGLSRLLGLTGKGAVAVRVPGVGPVWLRMPDTSRPVDTLRESRYRRSSNRWSTVTPLVHSRYLPRKSEQALFEQVAAECSDVGLPAPSRIAVRRIPRFRGAPGSIDPRGLPASWTGPLRGPQAHLDLWFDEPVLGPILLGRARHFGLGLCLPFRDEAAAAKER